MADALHTPTAAASFPRRAAAALIDGGVLVLAVQALHWGLAALYRPAFESGWAWHAYLTALVTLPCAAYYALFEGSARNATLGKRWLGLRVVDVYGGRVDRAHAWIRAAVRLVPWEIAHVALCFPEPVFATGELPMPRLLFSVYGLLGLYLATALMTLKKQSIHDLAAGTYVVDARVGVAR